MHACISHACQIASRRFKAMRRAMDVPPAVARYLSRGSTCSICGGAYFAVHDDFVLQGSLAGVSDQNLSEMDAAPMGFEVCNNRCARRAFVTFALSRTGRVMP